MIVINDKDALQKMQDEIAQMIVKKQLFVKEEKTNEIK